MARTLGATDAEIFAQGDRAADGAAHPDGGARRARRRVGDAGRLRADRRAAGARRADPERVVVLPARHHLRRHHLHRPASRWRWTWRCAPRRAGSSPGRTGSHERARSRHLPMQPMRDASPSIDVVASTSRPPHGPMRVVDDVTSTIRHGEFVSIIGPSGCGKTTLMNIVGGFVKPTRGQVLLDDEPVAGPGPRPRRDLPGVRRLSVAHGARQNIAFGLELAANRAAAAERDADRRALHGADGPDRFRRRTIPSTCRAACASASRSRAPTRCSPQFLLMDEPFGALDAQTRTRDAGPAAAGARDRGQDGDADHAFGRGGDLPLVADRRRDGAAGAHPRTIIDVPFALSARRNRCTRIARFGELRSHIRDLVMKEYARRRGRPRAGARSRPATTQPTRRRRP